VNGEPATEASSILSSSSSSDGNIEDDPEICPAHLVDGAHHGHHVDIRGWALTRSVDFWLHWTTLGVMTGIGLMTIKWELSLSGNLWPCTNPLCAAAISDIL